MCKFSYCQLNRTIINGTLLKKFLILEALLFLSSQPFCSMLVTMGKFPHAVGYFKGSGPLEVQEVAKISLSLSPLLFY